MYVYTYTYIYMYICKIPHCETWHLCFNFLGILIAKMKPKTCQMLKTKQNHRQKKKIKRTFNRGQKAKHSSVWAGTLAKSKSSIASFACIQISTPSDPFEIQCVVWVVRH